MKEVKGLEDRLYGLEQLLFGARKKVQEQFEMSQVSHDMNSMKIVIPLHFISLK